MLSMGLLHWYKIERDVPGPSPCVSDQTFPGPEYNFLLWAFCYSPEFSRDFWKFVLCTCSQAVIFPEIPLPRPGIFRNIWKWFSVLVSRPEFSGIVPFPSLEYLGSLGISKQENCRYPGSIHWSSDKQADVLPLHHQFI